MRRTEWKKFWANVSAPEVKKKLIFLIVLVVLFAVDVVWNSFFR